MANKFVRPDMYYEDGKSNQERDFDNQLNKSDNEYWSRSDGSIAIHPTEAYPAIIPHKKTTSNKRQRTGSSLFGGKSTRRRRHKIKRNRTKSVKRRRKQSTRHRKR